MQLKLGTTRETPGPGAYRPPSDFGYLEIIKSPRTSQSPRNSASNSFFTNRIKGQGDHNKTITFAQRNASLVPE